MYQDQTMLESIKKVEAARAENVKLDPRRMTAEEKEQLLATYHPDYREEGAGGAGGAAAGQFPRVRQED